jgi:hypothetical protein
MRNIVTAIALATVMASPAFAKTVKYYDMAPDQATTFRGAPAHSFEGSEYVGSDPDPRIQSELRRDPADDR